MNQVSNKYFFNMPYFLGRGFSSNPKMEYQVFLCIFQKNLAMATYGLNEMGKFLGEGREKGEGKTVNLSARYI